MNHWNANTEVRPSTIHGFGRFACDPIPAGEIVLIVMGRVLPNERNTSRMPIRGTGFVIDCEQTFVNHSRDANLVLDGQIVFRAAREIREGEELTIDYRTLTSGMLPFEDAADAS